MTTTARAVLRFHGTRRPVGAPSGASTRQIPQKGCGWHFFRLGWENRIRMRDWGFVLSRSRLEALAALVKSHDARIVLSTAWRTDHGARRVLAAALTELCGLPGTVFEWPATPELRDQPRAREIVAWLAKHDPARTRRWIAIDDINLARDDPAAMAGRFVHTSIEAGLSDSRAAFADALLRRQGEPAEPEEPAGEARHGKLKHAAHAV